MKMTNLIFPLTLALAVTLAGTGCKKGISYFIGDMYWSVCR